MATRNGTGRRRIRQVPKLVKRVWNDAAPDLYDFLRNVLESDEGIPGGDTGEEPSPIHAGDSSLTGTLSAGWAPGDHIHSVNTAAPVFPTGTIALEGTATALLRADAVIKQGLVSAKGELVGHSVLPGKVPAPTLDGQVLMAKSSQDVGLVWSTIPAAPVSVTSNELSAVSAQAASAHSVLSAIVSNLNSAHNALSNVVSNIISSGGGGTSVTSNELSAVSAQAQSAINVVSNALSNEISNRVSANNAISQTLSVLSSLVSNLTSAHNALSNRVSANSGTGGTTSVTSDEVSAVSAQAASAISQLNSVVSQFKSVVSQAFSVHSVLLDSFSAQIVIVSNAVSNANSAHNLLSNNTSASLASVNQALSVHSQNISVLSDKLSALSTLVNGISISFAAEVSNRISADNDILSVISQFKSVVSQSFSTMSQAISVVSAAAAATSNTVSNLNSIVSQGLSVISQAQSVQDSKLSTISAAICAVSAQGPLGPGNGLQGAVDAISNRFSNLNSNVQSISPQNLRTRTAVVSVISAVAMADIVSMSCSCDAGAIYEILGALALECGTSGGLAFGVSTPALKAAGSYIRMEVMSATTQGSNAVGAVGYLALSAVAAGNTVVASVSITTVNSMRFMEFKGMLQVSAGGTFQVMAKTSVAGASMSVRGGYIKSYKIG